MEDYNMNLEEGELDLFNDHPQPVSNAGTKGFTYYNYLESWDSSQDSWMKLSMTPNL